VVWVLSPPIEDTRRQTRERLVKERTAHRNPIQIKGLLAAQGVTSVKVGAPDWLDRLTAVHTGRSGRWPPGCSWTSPHARENQDDPHLTRRSSDMDHEE